MKNKVLIPIVAIIGGIALLVIGCYAGILIQTQKVAPRAPRVEKALKVMEWANSKVISFIGAAGKVTNISGRILTVTSEEENLEIPIGERAEVISFIFPSSEESEEGPTHEVKEFKDIKVGDMVDISLIILPDGSFEGTSVIILSASIFPAGEVSE